MLHSTYLIVGAGMAADAAVKGIREVDQEGSIVMIGAEFDPPYKRPMLSKGLWAGKPLDKVWSNTASRGADIRLGRQARLLDLNAHQVVDDRGETYSYEKLLIATGSTPRDPGLDDRRIINFRSLQDYRRLRAVADNHQRVAVIGGGFIGSELAASLATNGKDVTMIFPAETIADRVLPPDLGHFMTDYYRDKGVTVLTNSLVFGASESGDETVLRIRNEATGQEHELTVDGVVAGIGAEPNVELAQTAGLEVDNGVLVDEYLRTSHPDVYAAGDIASFWQAELGERRRVEHEDNAKSMGRIAGTNMAGGSERYEYMPFFYSDLFDMGYEAVGDVDARLETVADWAEPMRKGVIYYLRYQRVRGVLLWNVWGQVDAARALIAEGAPIAGANLAGRLLVPA